MIVMVVGDEDGSEPQAVGLQVIEYRRGVARINHRGAIAFA